MTTPRHPVTGMFTAAADAELATQAGMAAFRERQDFYMAHPEGIQVPGDRPEWHAPLPSLVPVGLGMMAEPDPAAVYVADRPGLVPVTISPPPVTLSPPVSLSGVTHGGYGYQPAAAAPGDGVVYAGAPPRRSLWARLLGRH
jgi:hypothetical protein